jgi:mannosyl-oligosaccharide glucosidase
MIFFAQTLERVAEHLGLPEDVKRFRADKENMVRVLYEIFWDPESASFTDITFSESGVMKHVVHKGYLSILPLALEIIPNDSKYVKHILDLMDDPHHLWSDYGLCSLSKKDAFFGQGENYWRGPIWMNINYLVLQALHRKYMKPGPYQQQATKMYTALRHNLITNIYKQYESTGFIWEQYSCIDGKGSRSHPFTGWTSLLLLIMAETYQ